MVCCIPRSISKLFSTFKLTERKIKLPPPTLSLSPPFCSVLSQPATRLFFSLATSPCHVEDGQFEVFPILQFTCTKARGQKRLADRMRCEAKRGRKGEILLNGKRLMDLKACLLETLKNRCQIYVSKKRHKRGREDGKLARTNKNDSGFVYASITPPKLSSSPQKSSKQLFRENPSQFFRGAIKALYIKASVSSVSPIVETRQKYDISTYAPLISQSVIILYVICL